MLGRFLHNYVLRHKNRGNQIFHAVGLPVTFIVPVVLLVQERPTLALISFLLGYTLQFIGHAIEGNDAGEVILVKKLLGKSYREFGPGVIDSTGRRDIADTDCSD